MKLVPVSWLIVDPCVGTIGISIGIAPRSRREEEVALSLVGNLADLSLVDIFQIVSLSRRSGTLTLNTQSERGEIVFFDGRVISASRSGNDRNVGDVLLANGVVPPVLYQRLLSAQARGLTVGELRDEYEIDADAWESTLNEFVSDTIYSMFEWDEGTFSFALERDLDPLLPFSLDSRRAVVSGGLNPQFLAMEGARLRDEKAQHDSLSEFLLKDKVPVPRPAAASGDADQKARPGQHLEPEHSEISPQARVVTGRESTSKVIPFPVRRDQPSDAPVAVGNVATQRNPLEKSGYTLLLLDDDPMILTQIERHLGPRFDDVRCSLNTADAIEELDRLDSKFVVVADLLVPRSDGRGILGGLELAESIRKRELDTPILFATDFDNPLARQSAAHLGAAEFLLKPGRGRITRGANDERPSEPMTIFLNQLIAGLEPYFGEEQPRDEAREFGSELASDIREIVDSAGEDLPPRSDGPASMSFLRSMLAELVSPENRETITLLVLRFADQIVERAALFLVTRDAYVGLGGFSSLEGSDQFVARVRRTHVPTESGVVFDRVVRYEALIREPLVDDPINRALIERLGGGWHSGESVVAPLTSGGRVAAVLFGDNPSGQPLAPTEGLEIFLQQAGLAMDRALLERRLEESKRERVEE